MTLLVPHRFSTVRAADLIGRTRNN